MEIGRKMGERPGKGKDTLNRGQCVAMAVTNGRRLWAQLWENKIEVHCQNSVCSFPNSSALGQWVPAPGPPRTASVDVLG